MNTTCAYKPPMLIMQSHDGNPVIRSAHFLVSGICTQAQPRGRANTMIPDIYYET